jgi:uncharacterized protein (DUF2236 family)
MTSGTISSDDFEAAIGQAVIGIPSDQEGLFGPRSLLWQVGREAFVFLGAGRAALLQTAHPFVAAAVDQHSDVTVDPAARFRRTFTNVFDMVFGTKAEALARAYQVRRIHDHIDGTLNEALGSYLQDARYSAHDRQAVQWVHATLWDTALRIYEMFHPPLTSAEKEHYWRDSLRFAALFGLRAEDMPQSFSDFETWWSKTLEGNTLEVGKAAKDIADHLLHGKGTMRALPKWYIAVTAGLLPPQLREAYGLTFGPLDRNRAQSALSRLQKIHPLMPKKLSFVPGYHRADARLKGKAAPDIVTRGLEKLWLGR